MGHDIGVFVYTYCWEILRLVSDSFFPFSHRIVILFVSRNRKEIKGRNKKTRTPLDTNSHPPTDKVVERYYGIIRRRY